MFKGILCAVIILSCGMLGIFKSQTYSQRVRELNDLREMIMMLQTEISYMKDPLPVIFQRIGNTKDNVAMDILSSCSVFMKDKQDMQRCWTSAVDMAVMNSSLTPHDKSIIYDMGIQLGRSNVKGQQDLLDMVDEKLLIQLREAEEHKRSKGKMYAGMGFSVGIVVAVIFL